MLWPDKPFVPKGTGKLTLHNAAPVQEPDEWPTGCPECGMDSGCDCDSGTWNPPAAQRQWVGLTDECRKQLINEVWSEYIAGIDDGKTFGEWMSVATEAKLKEKNNG
jgi:hypothetical protein